MIAGALPTERGGIERRPRRLAVFDFDGTLTTRDTFRSFLPAFGGGRSFLLATVSSLHLVVLGFLVGGATRNRAKAQVVHAVFQGRAVDDYRKAAEVHARRISERWLRARLVRQLAAHLQRGDRVVIISASLDAYVRLVAERLGVAEVYATELEQVGTLLTGRLRGANVRGRRKIEIIEQLRRPDDELWVYGDSRGDGGMLRIADVGVRLRPWRVRLPSVHSESGQ